MMSITIYHNPRCSKSRNSLALLTAAGGEPVIVEYLKTPPDAERIQELAALMGVPVAGLLRRGEAEFKEATDLPDLGNDAELAAWLAEHPKVIERPIVVSDEGDAAVIGRPPENVLGLIR
jgi:arsenate reductase